MRYHTRLYTLGELRKLIESKEGFRVGWELDAKMHGVMWKWARLVYDRDGEVRRCEFVRDATREEAQLLSHLLKGDILCRYQRVREGNPWAFAALE